MFLSLFESQAVCLLFAVVFLVAAFDSGEPIAPAVGAVVCLFVSMVDVMLLYGVVKEKPSYMKPFLCITLCEFFLSISHLLRSRDEPHNSYNPQSSSVSEGSDLRLISAYALLFRILCFCVVWKCYRYLKMREMILPVRLHSSAESGVSSALSRNHDLSSPATHDVVIPPELILPSALHNLNVSPPDYETATKTNGLAPSGYETAVWQQQQVRKF